MTNKPRVGLSFVKNNSSGYALPNADRKNKIAAIINVFFLPILFARNPEMIPPITHPISALETVKPWTNEPKPKLSIIYLCTDCSAPDITAVS